MRNNVAVEMTRKYESLCTALSGTIFLHDRIKFVSPEFLMIWDDCALSRLARIDADRFYALEYTRVEENYSGVVVRLCLIDPWNNPRRFILRSRGFLSMKGWDDGSRVGLQKNCEYIR